MSNQNDSTQELPVVHEEVPHHSYQRKKRLKQNVYTWIVVVIAAAALLVSVLTFALFPVKYKLPVLVGIGAVVCVTGIISFLKYSNRKKKSIAVINVILSVLLAVCAVFLPLAENQVKGIFSAVSTQKLNINVYAMSSTYREAHTDLFTETKVSENIIDYTDKTFITQTTMDQENQSYALERLANMLGTDTLTVIQEEDVVSAAEALYNNLGDALIINEAYISSLEDLSEFENFEEDTVLLYTIVKEVEVEIPEETVETDVTSDAFQMFVAGSDTRSTVLSLYGRTDVDIMLSVNPSTRQILIVSIPRDYYIANPALDNGLDKLTHLGNNGITNTMAGLNQKFNVNLSEYALVNFTSFKTIIDALGGVDIENPYAFTTDNGRDPTTGEGFTFAQGSIHLNGTEALAYVRERYNLENGDYDRSMHQMLVLEAIMKKLTSSSVLSNAGELLSALQGQVLTSMDSEEILKLASKALDDGGEWNIITYHLGGVGTMAGTASMGWDRLLYVAQPIETQVTFVNEQITKLMNGETLVQETLPNEDDTVYIDN